MLIGPLCPISSPNNVVREELLELHSPKLLRDTIKAAKDLDNMYGLVACPFVPLGFTINLVDLPI